MTKPAGTLPATHCPFLNKFVAPILNTFYQHLHSDESVLINANKHQDFPQFQGPAAATLISAAALPS